MDKTAKSDDDRRSHHRFSVNIFLQAAATLRKTKPFNDDIQPSTGMLVNISTIGAQVLLPGSCGKIFQINEPIIINIVLKVEDIKIDLNAKVKSIAVGQCYDTVRIGLEFIDLETNEQGRDAVYRLCELADKFQVPSMI